MAAVLCCLALLIFGSEAMFTAPLITRGGGASGGSVGLSRSRFRTEATFDAPLGVRNTCPDSQALVPVQVAGVTYNLILDSGSTAMMVHSFPFVLYSRLCFSLRAPLAARPTAWTPYTDVTVPARCIHSRVSMPTFRYMSNIWTVRSCPGNVNEVDCCSFSRQACLRR